MWKLFFLLESKILVTDSLGVIEGKIELILLIQQSTFLGIKGVDFKVNSFI